MIDSSALVAIIRGEPEVGQLQELIRNAFPRLVGAPTVVETFMTLLSRHGRAVLADFEALRVAVGIETVPLAPEHVSLAMNVFRRFGKGRHEAGLKFGDCMSYTLAKATGEPRRAEWLPE